MNNTGIYLIELNAPTLVGSLIVLCMIVLWFIEELKTILHKSKENYPSLYYLANERIKQLTKEIKSHPPDSECFSISKKELILLDAYLRFIDFHEPKYNNRSSFGGYYPDLKGDNWSKFAKECHNKKLNNESTTDHAEPEQGICTCAYACLMKQRVDNKPNNL